MSLRTSQDRGCSEPPARQHRRPKEMTSRGSYRDRASRTAGRSVRRRSRPRSRAALDMDERVGAGMSEHVPPNDSRMSRCVGSQRRETGVLEHRVEAVDLHLDLGLKLGRRDRSRRHRHVREPTAVALTPRPRRSSRARRSRARRPSARRRRRARRLRPRPRAPLKTPPTTARPPRAKPPR